ncbi:MAG: ABC transporter ATP-binding protein/permease [Lachnospiraceae bacterium]|nr:ABC transporter ATP-binding protein/permease [Lachnospiraceae bacterium]
MPRIQPRPLKKEDLKKNAAAMKRLFRFLFSHFGFHLIVVAVCIVISVLANTRGTLFLQTLIDDYIQPMIGSKDPDYLPLAIAIGKMAAIYGAGILAMLAQNLIMARVTQGALDLLRRAMFDHMEGLPIRYFDTHPHGDIMSLYTNDIDTLRQMVSQSLPQFLNSLITIVTVLICMIRLSLPLTFVTLFMVFVMMTATKKIAGRSGKYYMAQQKDIASVNSHIEEMMNGQKVIKVFNHEPQSVKEFLARNDRLFDSAYHANKYANVLAPVNAQLGNASFVLSAVIGGLLAIFTGNLSLGALASFLNFNRSFTMPINQVSQQLNFIVMAMAGADRIFTLLDEKQEPDDGYVTLVNARVDANGEVTEVEERTGTWAWKHYHKADNTTTYKLQEGQVVYDGVDFGYNEDKQVLFDISLQAQPGQKIAFVGATGAGKTTIINLINRFYDIEDGKIRIDGINVNKIKKADLRRSMGLVLQDTHLFTGTVADNIRFGKLDASDEEVRKAAKLANADGFIRRLPQGYDTMLTGNGANLSQGQRQLLAIARAAIYDPPVLVLDEATSSIDTRTEKLVQEGLDALMKGRTSFVIAHRLSTIRNADCIMVMDQGRIIESGNHDDLMAQRGKYYQLYTGKVVNA